MEGVSRLTSASLVHGAKQRPEVMCTRLLETIQGENTRIAQSPAIGPHVLLRVRNKPDSRVVPV